jgi:hypothetical protein
VANIIRLSVGGTMYGGEVWTVNPVFGIVAPGAPVGYDDCLTIATAANAVAIPTGLRALFNSQTTFATMRVESRLWDGSLEAAAEHVKGTPVAGLLTSSLPYQTSVVTSLRTAFPGAQGRGRLYWPATANILLGATMRIDPTTVTNLLAGVKTYLSGLETAVQATVASARLVVWSRTSETGHYVNRIQIGDVTDVQRRRRDTITENVTSGVYP